MPHKWVFCAVFLLADRAWSVRFAPRDFCRFHLDGAFRYAQGRVFDGITEVCFASVHGPCLAGCCLHSNSHWNGVSRQVLTARRDGNPFPGADHHRNRGEGSFSQISMPVMVVTLPVVFDGFKDHGKNKQSQQ